MTFRICIEEYLTSSQKPHTSPYIVVSNVTHCIKISIQDLHISLLVAVKAARPEGSLWSGLSNAQEQFTLTLTWLVKASVTRLNASTYFWCGCTDDRCRKYFARISTLGWARVFTHEPGSQIPRCLQPSPSCEQRSALYPPIIDYICFQLAKRYRINSVFASSLKCLSSRHPLDNSSVLSSC